MFFVYRFKFTVWDHLFFSARGTFFSISCKASLIATHCLSFWLFGNTFISPLFFKISFAGYRIFGWQFFVFLLDLYIWFFPPLVPNSRACFLLFACLFIFSNWQDYFSKVYLHPLSLPSSFPTPHPQVSGIDQGVQPQVCPNSPWDDSSFGRILFYCLFPSPHPTVKFHSLPAYCFIVFLGHNLLHRLSQSNSA